MLYKYRAFGLNISSLSRLSYLRESNFSKTEIFVHLETDLPLHSDFHLYYESDFYLDDGSPHLKIYSNEYYFQFRYWDNTTFTIDKKAENIYINWQSPSIKGDAEIYFISGILGFCLRIRKTFCLHAVSVKINNKAVIFMGDAEAGKSTLAAAFVKAGYQVFSDEIAAIYLEKGKYMLEHGATTVGLWEGSCKLLFDSIESVPLYLDNWPKRNLTIPTKQQPQGKFEVASIYYLLPRNPEDKFLGFEDIKSLEKFQLLTAQSYVNKLLTPELRKHEFKALIDFQKHVNIKAVKGGSGINSLNQLIAEVLKLEEV